MASKENFRNILLFSKDLPGVTLTFQQWTKLLCRTLSLHSQQLRSNYKTLHDIRPKSCKVSYTHRRVRTHTKHTHTCTHSSALTHVHACTSTCPNPLWWEQCQAQSLLGQQKANYPKYFSHRFLKIILEQFLLFNVAWFLWPVHIWPFFQGSNCEVSVTNWKHLPPFTDSGEICEDAWLPVGWDWCAAGPRATLGWELYPPRLDFCILPPEPPILLFGGIYLQQIYQ